MVHEPSCASGGTPYGILSDGGRRKGDVILPLLRILATHIVMDSGANVSLSVERS